MPSQVGRSSKAEEELNILAQRPRLENAVSTMDLKVLHDRFRCSDIFPKVSLELVREQDRKKGERIELAQTIAQRMATSFLDTFTGNKDSSKLVLRVNITVVSNGSCPRNSKIASYLGRGPAQGKGLAKLTVSYCLFNRVTGQVAIAKQLSRSQERSCDQTESKAVLMELEEELRTTISKEVKFSCCSRLPQWTDFSTRMIVVEPTEREDDDTPHNSERSSGAPRFSR